MSNLLIVESHNDKYFFEALISYINVHIEVDNPICSIDEYECLKGKDKLKNKLKSLKGQIAKEGIDKIGIIFDADDVGIEAREQEIQDTIKLVFGDSPDTIFSIYILNIDGKGELETLLKVIKSVASPMADCLDAWQQCLSSKNEALTQKDFDKIWVQVYHRHDCCSKKENGEADKNCNNKASFKKPIYDFNREELNQLKQFLKQLST